MSEQPPAPAASPSSPAPQNWATSFFTIWTGQAFSLLGSRIAQFALVWWLTQLTGSATILATASLVGFLPEVFLLPIAGAYVDRWNRRITMIVADGAIALASLWLVYLFWTDTIQVWHVYVILFVRSLGGCFHWPAMQASTSLMVPEQHLTRVAGINQTLFGTLSIFGPPAGALAMQLLPMHNVMMIDVVTALLAIVPLFFIMVPQPPNHEARTKASSFWQDMREGLHYLLQWRGMLILIGMVLIFKLATTPAFSLIPLLVSKHFEGDAYSLSLMETLLGVGIVIGGLILTAWGGFKRKILTSMSALAVSGSFFVLMGLTPASTFWIAVACMFLIGFFMPFVDGPFMAVLQSKIAPEKQGRVFSLIGSLMGITSPIGLAVAGPISDALGLQFWYIAAGILASAVAIAAMFVPAVVNIESANTAPSAPPA